MYRKLILGGPGSGKTTRLLEILDEQFQNGLSPVDVAFVSFTRKAVLEARDRASKKFGFEPEDMVYFRTIHSLGFKEMGLRRDRVLNKEHLVKLSEMTGLTFSARSEITPFQSNDGDKALFIENFARSTGKNYEDIWKYLGEYISYYKLKLFIETLKKYKSTLGLLDFTDMLELYVKQGTPIPVRTAIIDESQDLNYLQWKVVDKAFSEAEKVYIAGDDDQAIYKWSGADVNKFLHLQVNDTEVLPKSYRLGKAPFEYATGIISSVKDRYPKRWSHADHEGSVNFTRYIDKLDFTKGSWYLLARNKYLLKEYEDILYKQGVPHYFLGNKSIDSEDIQVIRSYEVLRNEGSISGKEFKKVLIRLGAKIHNIKDDVQYSKKNIKMNMKIWHDQFTSMAFKKRMYYLTALKSKQKLVTENPKVVVDTIHAVKGGQSDNVVIMTDISNRTWENLRFDKDDETRVFYVGITRCKQNLFVVLPKSIRYYPFKE